MIVEVISIQKCDKPAVNGINSRRLGNLHLIDCNKSKYKEVKVHFLETMREIALASLSSAVCANFLHSIASETCP